MRHSFGTLRPSVCKEGYYKQIFRKLKKLGGYDTEATQFGSLFDRSFRG